MDDTGDLLKMVKVCVEPETLFGWVDHRRVMHQFAKESLNNVFRILNSEFFFLQDWLPYQD